MITISVLLPLPIKKLFDYNVEIECQVNPLQVGQFVLVPFKNTEKIGLIWQVKDTRATQQETESKKISIKSVIKVYHECASVTRNTIKFLEWVSDYNIIPIGMVLKMSMPKASYLSKISQIYAKNTNINDAEVDHATQLSKAQQIVAQNILKSSKNFAVTLLDGVTGSGKTEVYSYVTHEILKQGGQILILLPEIMLSANLFAKLQEKFRGDQIFQWHSAVTQLQKRLAWQAAINGIPGITIGARSALFLPFSNLKLIVIDEEHDASFKQEEGQIYHARDMAIVRGMIESIPVILSSATPSIETYFNAKAHKYQHAHLPQRFTGIEMPDVKIIDMNNEILPKGHWISNNLKSRIAETLQLQKQAIIFLNRRGYAPITICSICKAKAQCKNCNFHLVLHKKQNILQCHYCGYSIKNNNECASCGSKEQNLAYGPGIERIAEEIATLFPYAKIAILTSDITKNNKEAASIIQSIHSNEVNIIIGTQVIAKGLHFKNLHLVGIIDADANHSGCDPRSLEKTYQLLHQVAGRAGRENIKGIVCIQTYNPGNVVLQHLVSYDREKFLESELADRKIANMPPFSRLATVTFACKDEVLLTRFVQNININSENIIGPAPAPIFKLKSFYRYRVVIRLPQPENTQIQNLKNSHNKKINMQSIIRQFCENLPKTNGIKTKIDIDPYNFL